MKNLEALHPGMVLKTMFLEPLKLSVYRVAKDIHVPQTRLSQIIAGERAITPDTALRLSKYFGLEEIFWLELQAVYDLAKQKALMKEELDAIQPFQPKNSFFPAGSFRLRATLKFWRTMAWRLKTEELPR